MAFRLSAAEIRHHFVEWRNLKRLHAEQKARNERLAQENRELKRLLAYTQAELSRQLEVALLRIADLEKMVFGSQHHRGRGAAAGFATAPAGKPRQPRPKSSYQRPTPRDEDVTTIKHQAVTACRHCGGALSRFEDVVRYVEDIILPQLLHQATKIITKHIIERGYCASCGNWTAARPLRGQLVALGTNIKLLVTYLVTILDCSYEQVKTLTSDLYDLTLSDGEIVHILQETAHDWLPEYERLKETIRAGPGAHVDETTWPIQVFAQHCFAWVMSAVNSAARVYKLATSRGKDHATELLGDDFRGVRITDCYAGYKNMPGLHQICWAHLYRKIRDLLTNENLPADKQPVVQAWHDDFKQLYADLRACLAEPWPPRRRQRQERAFRERLAHLRQQNRLDPKPLADLKALLVEYDHALFTCLRFPNIPCDNNRAERDLRCLVIKRKKSFGSRTEAGAHALEILLSVTWSTWYEHRGDFFPTLAKLTAND